MANYSATIRNNRLNADLTTIGNSALLQLYSGTKPATGAAITSQVKLSEHVCGAPFAPSATGGVQTANAIAPGTGLATGTATWARLVTSGAVFVADFTAGVGGGFEVNMTGTAAIAAGQTVNINSFVRTAGNA